MTKQPIKTGEAIPEQRTGVNLEALGIMKVPNGRGGYKLSTPITEQPNQNLMLIDEIEGLLSQVNEKIGSLNVSGNNKV